MRRMNWILGSPIFWMDKIPSQSIPQKWKLKLGQPSGHPTTGMMHPGNWHKIHHGKKTSCNFRCVSFICLIFPWIKNRSFISFNSIFNHDWPLMSGWDCTEAWWETPMGVGVWAHQARDPPKTGTTVKPLRVHEAVMRVHERYHGKCSTLAPFPGPDLLEMVTSLTSDADSMQQKWKTWSCHFGSLCHSIFMTWSNSIAYCKLLPKAS